MRFSVFSLLTSCDERKPRSQVNQFIWFVIRIFFPHDENKNYDKFLSNKPKVTNNQFLYQLFIVTLYLIWDFSDIILYINLYASI